MQTIRSFTLQEAWPHYQRWHLERGAYVPWSPNGGDGIFFGDRKPVCGCLVFDTTGPFFFVEYAATDPGAPLRERHRCFVAMLMEIRKRARATGKDPVCLVKPNSGIEKLLLRCGFRVTNLLTWTT